MIPVPTQMTEIDNLDGEEVAFTIGDPRWVMRSLADLYSNREKAVAREYSTNARDAMVMAGKANEPIRVTLPTLTDPYFTVTDTGVGMSAQTLKERYTKFGDSDKRDTNDANGMLGFGCKSAVAYTNTFTVTSVKDGFKTIAVISRKEDYSIVLKILRHVDTNDANGTTVKVPVHNPQAFSHIARDFYRFWKPGTVIVDGVEPEWAVGDKIDDDLFYYPNAGESYVVMGNVAYRIENPDALFKPGMQKISFVAYVDNGAVEFTPNREDLKYSPHTKAALHGIIDNFVAKSLELAKTEISSAATPHEAFAKWSSWRSIIGAANVADLEFKGTKFVDTFNLRGMRYNSNADRYNTQAINTYTASASTSTVFITSFPANVSSAHKKRAREWRTLKGLSASVFVFVYEDKVDSPWIDPARVVSWEQVKKDVPTPKRPKSATVGINWGRKAGTFDLITKNGYAREQDIPDTKELYWISLQAEKGLSIGGILHGLDLDWTVVIVPANRTDKFLRNYKAQRFIEAITKMVEFDGKKLISDEGKERLLLSDQEVTMLNKMDVSKIDDPNVASWKAIAKKDTNSFLKKMNTHQSMAAAIGKRYEFNTPQWANRYGGSNRPVTQQYPLLREIAEISRYNTPSTETLNHIYFYMNSLYAARKEGKNV